MEKFVRLTVKNRRMKIETSGFEGNECEKVTDQLQLNGFQEEERELKPEYHNAPVTETEKTTW